MIKFYFSFIDKKNIPKQTNGKTILPMPPGACPTVTIGLYMDSKNRDAHSKNNIKYIKGIKDLYLKATIN